ncbi:hypothetical protein CLIB1423_10S02718 [[Candida] railenensis]|uniref:Bul1 C-terminal domain-containing protein n=1 Tax=[Candida] railenensis TaxID=45579 RepID=A0A9P0QPY5_9ASCO|nr:hypothetical protein CLIB1423_10S02718 [[Candida] railenensis]
MISDSDSTGSRTSTESEVPGLSQTDESQMHKPKIDLSKEIATPQPGAIPRTIGMPPLESLNLSLNQPRANMPPNSPDYTEEDFFAKFSAEKAKSISPTDKHTSSSSISGSGNTVPVWSILPSYHMYTSTISKSLDLNDDNNVFEPPTYDDISTISSSHTLSNPNNSSDSRQNSTSNINSRSSVSSESSDFIVADESTGQWQETILDNVHKLKRLTDCEDNSYAKNLKIEMFFTEDVGRVGVKPNFVDVSKYEYKQGDLINGYVMVENLSDKPIPFDMFYVLFEGNFSVQSNFQLGSIGEPKVVSKKFLEMFDFSASWNYAHINRLVTEFTNPHTCPDGIDHLDNTRQAFGSERLIQPNRKYKRFFTFQIPNNLLDSTCDHSLSMHTALPPTIGTPRSVSANSKSKVNQSSKVKDFSFIDTNISYSVDARFIGKASMYGENKVNLSKRSNSKIINTSGDEFLILKDTQRLVRIVQENEKIGINERIDKFRYDKLLLDNFMARVDERLEYAEEMLAALSDSGTNSTVSPIPSNNSSTFLSTIMSPGSVHSSTSSALSLSAHFNSGSISSMSHSNSISQTIADELTKCRQLYKPKGSSCSKRIGKDGVLYEELDFYKMYFPFQKKSITGASKFLGTVILNTPRIPYVVKYIQPLEFCQSEVDSSSLKFQVPINLEYVLSESNPDMKNKVPEIKKVSVELIAETIKSDEFPLPFEINHDMLFENNKLYTKTHKSAYEYDTDYFDQMVVKPTKRKVSRLKTLAKELGPDVFRMEAKLASDIKSICNLKTKRIIMTIEQVTCDNGASLDSVCKQPWAIEEKAKNITPTTYTKRLNLDIDLSQAKMKTGDSQHGHPYDNFCLIPSFQMCYMARVYYLKIVITLSKGESLLVHIPVEVTK